MSAMIFLRSNQKCVLADMDDGPSYAKLVYLSRFNKLLSYEINLAVTDVRYLHGRNLAPGVEVGRPIARFGVMILTLLDVFCSRDSLSSGNGA
ncbi:MAG: hypothetical protein LQ343_004354 [Gyalolechia ehrenbergii]|nr:MAG: hypothetical protein LQ343_004354 [Gyalolechia ehrenbergii]